MCRDKSYAPAIEEHILRWEVGDNDYFVSSYHQVAGTAEQPVIVHDSVERRNVSIAANWGIVPKWTKSKGEGLKEANRYVNAKAETLKEGRLYKPMLEQGQRCLIPCTAYFEHHWLDAAGKKKVPFAVRKADDPIFSTPGLYELWTDRSTGEVITSYTMLTTAANALMKKVHNGGEHPGRMPLVIERDMEAVWLNPKSTDKELDEVLKYHIPAGHLEAWPVHKIRGRSAATGPAVLEEDPEYKDILRA